MAETCRACLVSNIVNEVELMDIFSIFNMTSTNVCLADALMECASIQISKDDSLPKLICTNCVKNLHVAHRFRSICMQSDIQLRRQLFDEMKTENVYNQLIDDQLKVESLNSSAIDKRSISEHFETNNELLSVDKEKISQQISTCKICQLNFVHKNLLDIHTKKYHTDFSKEIKSTHEQKRIISKNKHSCRRTSISYSNAISKFCTKDESEVKIESWGEKFEAEDIIENTKSDNDVNNSYFADSEKNTSKKITPNDYNSTQNTVILDEILKKVEKCMCMLCKKSFRTRRLLELHLKGHTRVRELKKPKSSSPHTCVTCKKTFVTKSALIKHEPVHTGLRSYECSGCDKKFKQRAHLSVHMRVHTGERPYECKVCKKRFIVNSSLKKHQRQCTLISEKKDISKEFSIEDESDVNIEKCIEIFEAENTILNIKSETDVNKLYFNDLNSKKEIQKSFTCKICDKEFSELNALNRHSVLHIRQDYFTCQLCSKTFIQSSHFDAHIRSHTDGRPFECKICPKKFITNSALTQHHRIHSVDPTSRNSGPFVCVTCTKTFNSNTALQNHMRIHSGERPFQCEYCGKGFKQKIHLTIHRKSHTGDKKFTCEICSKNFITNSALKKHMELHSDVPKPAKISSGSTRWYYCEQCPKTFPAKHLLVKHSRTHTGEAPFMCEICGKTFRQNAHLTVHIRQHTGEKPFPCNICGKTFTTSTEMRIHKVLHTDELPHQCSHCDMRFKWKITMWRHMMHHTGERPKKCTICDKAFVEGGALRRHMRVHTGERPQRCKICGRGFKENTHLKTHMKVHRND